MCVTLKPMLELAEMQRCYQSSSGRRMVRDGIRVVQEQILSMLPMDVSPEGMHCFEWLPAFRVDANVEALEWLLEQSRCPVSATFGDRRSSPFPHRARRRRAL